jgi:prepilin-type N-terminal cleavage/methylation domain-containing protein
MSRHRGFTFAEILVALAVFGALTAVAVPRYREYKERSYVASMKSELANLRIAEEAHWAEHQTYSSDTTSLDWNGSSHVQLTIASADLEGGFTAEARHILSPGLKCVTAVGKEAVSVPSGEIVCTSVGSAVGAGVTP